jgi:hypothetical protein
MLLRRPPWLTLVLASCSPFHEAAGDGGVPPGGGCEEGALDFDGAQHLDVDDAPELDAAGPKTVEAWLTFRAPAVAEQRQMDVLSHYAHGTDGGAGWGLLLLRPDDSSPFSPSFRVYDGVNSHKSIGGVAVDQGAWLHLALVLDGAGGARLYQNGVRMAAGELPTAADFAGVLRFGGAATNARNFRLVGTLAEVRISSAALYDGASFPPPSAPLSHDESTVALYRFDDGEGLVAGDTTGRFPALMPPEAEKRPRWVTAPCPAARLAH